jgi:hypothetical protein
MPTVPFASLSDDARIWVFAAERPIRGEPAEWLLGEMDRFLERWHAHGAALTCARDWRENRFLIVGVEGSDASGCSIDVLYRNLRAMEPIVGASLLAGGRVYYRDPQGFVTSATRPEFAELAAAGMVRGDTRVFDTSITSVAELRDRFERSVADSWHARLLRI